MVYLYLYLQTDMFLVKFVIHLEESEELMLLNCGVGADFWEFPGLQGDPTSPFLKEISPRWYWKDWCWSWNSNTLATSYEELTHLKRPWCWERLKAGGDGDDKGWDGWMASLTQWTWVWVDSGSWWWTGRPGVLWFMGSKRVGHDWVIELKKSHYWVLVIFLWENNKGRKNTNESSSV